MLLRTISLHDFTACGTSAADVTVHPAFGAASAARAADNRRSPSTRAVSLRIMAIVLRASDKNDRDAVDLSSNRYPLRDGKPYYNTNSPEACGLVLNYYQVHSQHGQPG
jgi:hypothetical protein